MHILLPYWMQPSRGVLQNASSKQFSKILRKNLDFFGVFLFEKMNPNLLANEIFSSILLKFQI